MTWQGSLFDGQEDTGPRLSFDALRRDPLDEQSWLDLVNPYRDGSDAVAWHADTVRRVMRDPLVATISLGA